MHLSSPCVNRVLTYTLIVLSLLSCRVRAADWRVNAQWPELGAELGAAMPNGTGIIVMMSEAQDGSGNYLPQATGVTPYAGVNAFSGKTLHAESGIGGESGHANPVASTFFGNYSSIAAGVTEAHVYLADDFYSDLSSTATPPTYPGSVQNHSWIYTVSSGTTVDNRILRKLDMLIDRDGKVVCVPLNNGSGTTVPILLANIYNGLTVGLKDGGHSQGGSTADGTGRMKPDLVVETVYTSFASPAVASAATLLLDAIRPAFPDADHPEVVKALLLAGATKQNLPAWQRDVSTEPYDDVLGAGELNILNSHHILAAGKQAFSDSAEATRTGWDYATASSGSVRRYFFTIPAGQFANTFSAALVWNRNITKSGLNFNASLQDLTLKLFASTAFTPSASPIQQSNSSVDNVEHLFLRNLPPGQYALEVGWSTSVTPYEYALAWESQIGTGPGVAIRRETDGVYLDASRLDPFVTYTVEVSNDLSAASWSSAGTFRTADTTPSFTHTWQDGLSSLPAAKFYRLSWPSVR
jgi:hypothetical protein